MKHRSKTVVALATFLILLAYDVQEGGNLELLDEEGVVAQTPLNLEPPLEVTNSSPIQAVPADQVECIDTEGVWYYLTPPVRGYDISSVYWADEECERWFPGSKWFEFHNTSQYWRAPGGLAHQIPDPTNAWIWNNDQQSECFENGAKGLTYRTVSEEAVENNSCYAAHCYAEGHVCNAYHGDTSCGSERPLLCIKQSQC